MGKLLIGGLGVCCMYYVVLLLCRPTLEVAQVLTELETGAVLRLSEELVRRPKSADETCLGVMAVALT